MLITNKVKSNIVPVPGLAPKKVPKVKLINCEIKNIPTMFPFDFFMVKPFLCYIPNAAEDGVRIILL